MSDISRAQDELNNQHHDRLKQIAAQSELERITEASGTVVGMQRGTNHPIVATTSGLRSMLPIGNMQSAVGAVGRASAGGIDLGSRQVPLEPRRRKRLDKIAQVFFRVVGADLVAYYVSDREVREIDRVPYASYSLANAWLILNERSESDITIVYRNGLAGSNLKFVWIDSQKVKRTGVKTDAIAGLPYSPLGSGQYRAGTLEQGVWIRRINRTTFSYFYAPGISQVYRRVRFQPYVPSAILAPSPADAFSVEQFVPSFVPPISFAITNETDIDQPALSEETDEVFSFTTSFAGTKSNWFGWFDGTVFEQATTGFSFEGTYEGREFTDRTPVQSLNPPSELFPNGLQTKIEFSNFAAGYKFHPAVPAVNTTQFRLYPAEDAGLGLIDGPPGGRGGSCQAIGLPIASRFPDAEPRKSFLGYFRGPCGYNFTANQFESIDDLMFCTVDAGTLTTQQILNPTYALRNLVASFYKDRQFYYYTDGTYDPPIPGTLTTETKIAIAPDGTATETTRDLILPDFADPSYRTTNIGASNLAVNGTKI